jgi:uncharacterized protein with PIN domain
MEIRCHLDESVNNAIANGLRLRGLDVTTSNDVGLVGSTDEQQLQHATSAGRVLVTHDDDFLTMHSRGVTHAGIAYAHPKRISIGQTIFALLAIHRSDTAESIHGRVVFLKPPDDDKVT